MPGPPATVFMTILVSTATTPNSTPTAVASSRARRQPDSRLATGTVPRASAIATAATATAGRSDPS